MAIIRGSNRRLLRGVSFNNQSWPVFGLVLAGACATTVSEDELNSICAEGRCTGTRQPEQDAGATGGSDTAGGGSTAAAGTANGGSMSNGGTQAAGGSTGGGGANGAGAGSGGGGAGGMGGAAGGTAGSGGGGAGGAAGAGGGGAGGASGGGAGGAGGTGGTGGSGGAPVCPAKTSWVPSSSSYCGELAACSDPNGPYPPSLASDASTTTRFSSGVTQAGGEWIQFDLSASAALDGITISTTNTDWTRAYEVRFAATANNIAAAPVTAMGTGMMGTITVTFPSTTTGRYLRITQTGAVVAPDTNWWSIHDITIDCH